MPEEQSSPTDPAAEDRQDDSAATTATSGTEKTAHPTDSGAEEPRTAPLGRRWFFGSVVVAFLLTFLQVPGLTVADTKYDLAENPLGFLERATHLWSSQAPMGQVQNQAYGYFFPHGAFFSLGDLLGLPAWVTQRIWWALLLLAGFWGIVKLCEALGIGSRGSRVIAAVAYALSPRVLTTLGSISSETLPMVLAPWALLAPVALGAATHRYRGNRRGGAHSPAGSALAVALMGAVNAAATLAAFLPALLWWASYRPNRQWWRFTRVWVPLLVLATCWWLVPLLLLGRVSPPFLDYIESASVTTQWSSLSEVLRGTNSWTPFVSPERIAGAVLVTQPAAVLATGLVAAAGMAGLAMRSIPARGRLALILGVGIAGICAGYVGQLDGPFAETVRSFLDSSGEPLRNVHKLEPLIRIPLVLGLAHLLAQVPLPASVPLSQWRSAFAHPDRDRKVAVTALILAALAMSTSLAWTGKLAPRGAYDEVPAHWQQTADWLRDNAADTRALVTPGAPLGSQQWGLTRDEPLQALAETPWAVRDAVPLNPPETIRAMDSVQRLIADGRPSDGLAATLVGQGVGVVVLRNDLDPDTARSTRPMLAHQALDNSPGLHKVTEFGPPTESSVIDDERVEDTDLRPEYPAVEIYRVEAPQPGTPAEVNSGTGAPDSFPGAYTVPVETVPMVQGGPEVLERLHRTRHTSEQPTLLAADAAAAELPVGPLTVTDTPMDREADFGKVDNHNSAVRAPDDERRTHNRMPDYAVPGAGLVQGQWSGAKVTASSSASDATQVGGSAPAHSTAAAFDGDPTTSWVSSAGETAVGQQLRLDLERPISSALLRLTTSKAAHGDPVKWVEVRTENGSVSTRIDETGEQESVSLPAGSTDWLTITAIRTAGDSSGSQFGISELSLHDYTDRDNPVQVDIAHRTALPPAADTPVRAWDLGQEFPGRDACFDAPDRVRCAEPLALSPEELATFQRTLSVPEPVTVSPELTVHPRQGPALADLLADRNRPLARAESDIDDLRGSAFAATDVDPRTSWTADSDSVHRTTTGQPTLTIDLPEPALVSGLDLEPSLGALPAPPTSVAVNLGNGPQMRELDDPRSPSRMSLHPTVTDRIEISLLDWLPMRDDAALGSPQPQPPGFAEVNVLGPDYPAPAPPNQEITIGCDAGPTISIGGKIIRTSVTATVDQLRSGEPVPAQACPDTETVEDGSTNAGPEPPGPANPAQPSEPANAVPLAPGQVDVMVAPSDKFFVDRLRLANTTDLPAPRTPASPPVGTNLLTLPLSTNSGWHAAGENDQELTPVVVDGWQQGWLVPPDAGPITVSFPADRWYRLAIFGGLLLLLPLVLLAIPRNGRSSTSTGPSPVPWASRWLGALGVVGTATVIAGPFGTALSAAGLAALRFVPRIPRTAMVVAAGVGTTVSTAALSTGPWLAPGGYMGGSLWVQVPALIALVAVGLAALPRRR